MENKDFQVLLVKLEANQRQFEKSMSRINKSTQRQLRQMDSKIGGTTRKFGRMAATLAREGGAIGLAIAAAVVATGGLVKVLKDAVVNADKMKMVTARFTALTSSSSAATQTVGRMFTVLSDTGAGFDTVAAQFTRFTLAAQNLGATQKEVGDLVEVVTKLATIGGAGAQEMRAGAIQLAQALASGTLRGDELNSVLENMPLVALQIAKGLDVDSGKLRKMGAAGKLTSRDVFYALLKGLDDTRAKFKEMPVTVERASSRMAASWTKFTAALAKSLGLSKAVVAAANEASDAMDAISNPPTGVAKAKLDLAAATQARDRFAGNRLHNLNPGMTIPGSTGDKRDTFGGQLSKANAAVENAKRTVALLTLVERAQANKSDAGERGIIKKNQYLEKQLRIQRETTANQVAQLDKKREDLKLSRALLAANAAEAKLRKKAPGVSDKEVAKVRAAAISLERAKAAADKAGGAPRVDTAGAGAQDMLLKSMHRQVDELSLQVSGFGQSAQAAAQARAEYNLLNQATDAGIKLTPKMLANIDDTASKIGSLTGKLEKLTATQEAAQEAARKSAEAQEEAVRRSEQAMTNFSNSMLSALESSKSLEDGLRKVGLRLLEITATGLLGGGPAGGLFNGLLGVASGGLGAAFNKSLGLPVVGPSGGISTNVGHRHFAKGGRPPVGLPSLVGERGPEVFVPDVAGRIIPNGGGGGTTVNQEIHFSVDTPTAARAAVMQMLPQIVVAAKAGVADGARRGGAYRKAIR